MNVEKGYDLAQTQRFFIIHNPSDNHGLDHQIAAALQARGLKVEIGPLTMMPEATQAVIVYQDRWAWDFGEHLVYLQIEAREPQNKPLPPPVSSPLSPCASHRPSPLTD